MTDDETDRGTLFNRRWVHVDGDDAEHGAVYHDATADIPLSRRPKHYLEFGADRTVRVFATGADDRAHEVGQSTWSDDAGVVTFRMAAPGQTGLAGYRIVEQAADRLVIRAATPGK